MKIFNELSESQLFRSKSAIRRLTARQAADLFHMHVCALMMLRSSPASEKWVKAYAQRTLNAGSFTEWKTNSTDFGILGWALLNENVEFRLPSASDRLREKLSIDEASMIRWLKSIRSPHLDTALTRRIFTKLDLACRITEESFRAIRRLTQDWTNLDMEEASLALTRLLQLFRAHGPQSEILPELEKLAKAYNLEILDVCNPETGEGCGNKHRDGDEPQKKKSGNLFAKMAAVAVGAGIGYGLTRKKSVKEDATVGATDAGSIAMVAQPFGAVQRRVAPTTIAIPDNADTSRRPKKKKPK